MEHGSQHFPHKYIKRVWANGRWDYSYAEDPKSKKFTKAPEGTQHHMVVIAHGKPTAILVDPTNSTIIYGPPQTKGKTLFINTNERKSYFGIARGPDSEVYLYPESILKRSDAKKAAKFLHCHDGLSLIDQQAEEMMVTGVPEHMQYGLAMWLNNNAGMRIGAHEKSGSVDVMERRRIINQARVEKWSDKDKKVALDNARTQTFGLLTLRAGHVNINPDKMTASFNFRSKGGKMMLGDMVSVKLPYRVYSSFQRLLEGKSPDEKVFPDVIYKRVYNHYKKYGLTPHISRGNKANDMIKALMDQYKVKEVGGEKAWRSFQKDIQENISDKLGHSAAMTQKAYIAPTTRDALAEFKLQMINHKYDNDDEVMESEPGIAVGNHLPELARTITWLEVGPGNEVI